MAAMPIPKNANQHIGLSTDTKPRGIEGDQFIETDRRLLFVRHGADWASIPNRPLYRRGKTKRFR